MKNFRKTPLIIASIIFIIAGLAAVEPTQHKFKNLKVLPKNISEDSLDKIMDGFKAALGVKCGYCHLRNDSTKKFDFASDVKPEKETARKMMLMTKGINKKYFNYGEGKDMPRTITCITCHRGNPLPLIDTTSIKKPGDNKTFK
ncbi:MAG: c-type cytochrome [Ferruginibacter sp.]